MMVFIIASLIIATHGKCVLFIIDCFGSYFKLTLMMIILLLMLLYKKHWCVDCDNGDEDNICCTTSVGVLPYSDICCQIAIFVVQQALVCCQIAKGWCVRGGSENRTFTASTMRMLLLILTINCYHVF